MAVHLVDELRDTVLAKGLKTGEEAADALVELIAAEMEPEREMELSGHPAVNLGHRGQWCGQDHQHCKAGLLLYRAGPPGDAGGGRHLPCGCQRTAGRLQNGPVCRWSKPERAPTLPPSTSIPEKSASARGYDLVIADTAGRLHNKANLMSELAKTSRSVKKAAPEASLETLLVLDSITGDNAISQAKEFCS